MKLKLLLFSLVSVGLSLSFSSALTIPLSYNNWTDSAWDSNLQFVVAPYGGVSSRRIGLNPKSVLYVAENENFNAFFFWDQSGFPYMYLKVGPGQWQHSSFYNEGIIGDYGICDEITSDTSASSFPSGCQYYTTNTGSVEVFSNFNTNTTTDDYAFIGLSRGYDDAAARGTFTVCFNNHSLGKSICYFASACYKHYSYGDCPSYGMDLNSLYNFDWSPTFDTLPESLLSFPPSSGFDQPLPDSTDVIVYPGLTGINQTYYDTFIDLGYYPSLCYSDFYIDNVVDSGTYFSDLFITDLDDSEPYTGATVFDLKNNRFSSFSNSAWFDNLNGFYRLVNNDHSNIIRYNGHSKGYFYLMFKMNNVDFIDSYTFSAIDYFTFCDMVVNGYSPNSIFTGDISISAGNVKQNKDYNLKVILSGADSGFSGDKDLFSIFNGLYSRFSNLFPVDQNLSNNTVGILPDYVIIAFFLFLLLYILKR